MLHHLQVISQKQNFDLFVTFDLKVKVAMTQDNSCVSPTGQKAKNSSISIIKIFKSPKGSELGGVLGDPMGPILQISEIKPAGTLQFFPGRIFEIFDFSLFQFLTFSQQN